MLCDIYDGTLLTRLLFIMNILLQITGAITSYLIILIQFNVTAQRGKNIPPSNSTKHIY